MCAHEAHRLRSVDGLKGGRFTPGEYDLVVTAFEECGRTRVHRVRTQGTLI
jgi:hypothetical protein